MTEDIKKQPQSNSGEQYTVAPLIPSDRLIHTLGRPEAYRLPRNRERDPHWGQTRAWYYEVDKEIHCLIHLRKKGKQRGVTLVDYEAISNYVRSQKVGAR